MIQGLTTSQAEKLLAHHGKNVIEDQKKKNIVRIFFDQINNFLTILLIIAALLSFFIGEMVDGSLILTIVILNACFGIYQERKAEDAIAALKQMTITKVRVIRDGREQELDSRYLVPGDILFIEEGNKVPADASVYQSINLEVNEAALTGESLPVVKKIHDEVYMGTIIAKGRGHAEVIATGMKTKFGMIATQLAHIGDSKTPLQQKLENITKTIGMIGIVVSVIVLGLSLWQGSGYFPSFLLAISLAVAVVPEGLPAVMTITLAIGVKEMAKRKAIMRKLAAVEALGSVTLIATDKTGTLTSNKMKVKEVYIDSRIIPLERLAFHKSMSLTHLVLDGILCSTASLVPIYERNTFDVLGDPTEGALLYMAHELKQNIEEVRSQWQLIGEQSFDSVTKRMSVVVKSVGDVDLRPLQFTKGAPESILSICSHIQIGDSTEKLSDAIRKDLEIALQEWAKKGLRVLAFSYEIAPACRQAGRPTPRNDVETTQTFLGMVAIHDAPRPEVKEAVQKAHSAGIKVVMITGDNEQTAEAIAVHTGLMQEGYEIVTGQQLDSYTDEELIKILPHVSVFARTTPFHKSRIVLLYQQLGEIVAVTGDGVNDAIAMKQADVGVAMGLVGTDVARETADMVITDDNFATIVGAIEEGRNIIKNLKNAIQYLLACNISEALALIIGLWLGIPHIFYAIQLLYINLATDGIPALALAFSPRLSHVMKEPPQKELTLLQPKELKYILSVGVLASGLVLYAYFLYASKGNLMAQTAAFSVLALIQSFILIDLWLSHRPIHRHARQLLSPIFLVAFCVPFVTQYALVKVERLADIFKVATVSTSIFIEFIFISGVILLAIKVVKKVIKL